MTTGILIAHPDRRMLRLRQLREARWPMVWRAGCPQWGEGVLSTFQSRTGHVYLSNGLGSCHNQAHTGRMVVACILGRTGSHLPPLRRHPSHSRGPNLLHALIGRFHIVPDNSQFASMAPRSARTASSGAPALNPPAGVERLQDDLLTWQRLSRRGVGRGGGGRGFRPGAGRRIVPWSGALI